MNKPLVKFQKTKAHVTYKLKDGTRVPGASTIAKIGDDPSALLYWAWDLGKQGIDYKKARESAADVGTLTHFLIQCHVRGEEADLSEFAPAQVSLAENCFLKFLEFWDSEKLEMRAVEQSLVSETFGFGGTIDMVCRDRNDSNVLLDWKSSNGIYRSHIIQASGYEQLWNEDKGFVPSITIKRRAIIRIGKSEQPDLEVRWLGDMSAYWNAFRCQLDLYQALKKIPRD